MTSTTIIGMDISKNSFELCGTDERGSQTLHKRLHRETVSRFFANTPVCTVAMESRFRFTVLGAPAQRVRTSSAAHPRAARHRLPSRSARTTAMTPLRLPKPLHVRMYAPFPSKLLISSTSRPCIAFVNA